MKVLYINTVCGVGSTGKIVTGLAAQLRRDNHAVKVAFGYGQAKGVLPEEAVKTVSKTGYYMHNLLTRLTDRQGLFSKTATRRWMKQIEKWDPDIIHLHNLHGHYLNYEILFSWLKQAGKPVVWTLHDCWAFTGHCTYFTAANCQQWKTACRKCTQLRQYPRCDVFGNSGNNYFRKKTAFTGIKNMTIVTPSRWLGELVKESFLKEYPVRTIPNGIDLSVFQPTDSDFREKYRLQEKFILLGVAFDWGHRKGLDIFIELAHRLDDRFQIVLVGTNETVDRLLPENIISIHRTQNQQELAQIYTAADLFVNPTREDNFPTVNLEALACGTPVVTYRTGGSPECIDETCGSVVDCDDANALVQEILYIEKERPYTKEACLQRAQKFDAQKRFGNYLDLYDKLQNQNSEM